MCQFRKSHAAKLLDQQAALRRELLCKPVNQAMAASTTSFDSLVASERQTLARLAAG